MALKSKDYVCVSGVSSANEAKEVGNLIRSSGFTMQTDHIPAIGIQVSWKSLELGYSEGNRRVPKFDQLPFILESAKETAFTTIHYYTEKNWQLTYEIGKVLDYKDIYKNKLVNGLQINRVFPRPGEIEALKDAYPELRLIVAVHPDQHLIGHMAKYLVRNYKELDYVIIDPSEGKGIGLGVESAASTYRILRDEGFDRGIVFAGNFNGENVRTNIKMLEESIGSRNFSIDAESGNRDKVGKGYGNDIINMGKVGSYLRGASEALLDNRE
jgi:hypothetical protein